MTDIFETKEKRKTDDGRDVVKVSQRKHKQILPEDIQREIDNLDKSILKFQNEKKRLEKIYAEITK